MTENIKLQENNQANIKLQELGKTKMLRLPNDERTNKSGINLNEEK